MATETLIYGLAEGETERYMETLLYRADKVLTEAQINKVQDYAKRQGWHSFRVVGFDLENAPSFADCVRGF